jgi:taurine dioxygenase
MAGAIKFHKLTKNIGAEVSGIDLSQPVTDEIWKTFYQGLLEHEVVFFRDQDISAEQFKDFALRAGQPYIHPAYDHVDGHDEVCVLESTPENITKIEKWHHDMTFGKKPPLGSFLYAQIIPESGGDTMWSSMSAAYDALSDRMKSYLEGMEAYHSFRYGFKESLAEEGGEERLAEVVKANPPLTHPVIRTHPESGKKGIFVNELFTTHLKDVPEVESEAILQMLYKHIRREEFTCRFNWKKGSMAIWDNRITQHRPVNDYFPAHRKLWRVTILGDEPR